MLVAAFAIAFFSHNTASNKEPVNDYEIVLHFASRKLHIPHLSLDDVRRYIRDYQDYIRASVSYTGCIDQGSDGTVYFNWHHVHSIDVKKT